MSEASRSTDERAPESEPIEGFADRASGSGAREALVELGDRARAVVEELARHARERREAASARPEDSVPPRDAPFTNDSEAAVPGLPQRLGELRACVGEVVDVLEATLERLETVELQLGDPDESVEKDLADGIARCERVLMGIEHHIQLGAGRAGPFGTAHGVPPGVTRARPGGSPGSFSSLVLVVSRSSRRRAELLIAVERQGLRAVAAHGLASALRAASRTSPEVALLDLEGSPSERVAQLEEWKGYQDCGALPPAAVLGGADSDSPGQEFENIREEHGHAAMAAVLVRIVHGRTDEADFHHGGQGTP